MEENKILIDAIIKNILDNKIFGTNFSFRKGQRECIEEICLSFLNYIENNSESDSIIISAPTGSGKSIIAMFTGKVLELLRYKGYIVTSDLMLQDQYEKDFNKFKKLNYFSVKGVDNYICLVNKQKYSLGDCRLRSMDKKTITKLPCFPKCGYLQARINAIKSNVSLLNYSYYLIQRNYVADKIAEDQPFKERDFVFFDEAHRIDEIVQNHFTPIIDNQLSKNIEELNNLLFEENYKLENLVYREDLDNIINVLYTNNDKNVLLLYLIELNNKLCIYLSQNESIREYSSKNIKDLEYVPNSWRKVFFFLDRIKDLQCKLEDYIKIIESTDINNIIKKITGDFINFNCLDESYLIEKHLHKKAKFKIFMSATIGEPERYIKIMNIKNAKVINLSNFFEYDKSPIFYITKYRLDYKNREKNIDSVIKIMDKIINKKHPNENGIIHTGSYEFMNRILKESELSGRFLSYNNSADKKKVIEIFSHSRNKILIGPSILEGLDLYNEKSRFQVFFKVPYPSLSDLLIQEKLKKSQTWYDWKTSIGILQGIGRSIRNDTDWAITYFLDGCINDLINKSKLFPEEFNKRLIKIF